jgi:hypothetical protein
VRNLYERFQRACDRVREAVFDLIRATAPYQALLADRNDLVRRAAAATRDGAKDKERLDFLIACGLHGPTEWLKVSASADVVRGRASIDAAMDAERAVLGFQGIDRRPEDAARFLKALSEHYRVPSVGSPPREHEPRACEARYSLAVEGRRQMRDAYHEARRGQDALKAEVEQLKGEVDQLRRTLATRAP